MYSDEIKKFRIKKDAVILAIESSCDETAAAIVKTGREILASERSAWCTELLRVGGGVPEIAARSFLLPCKGRSIRRISTLKTSTR